VLVTLAVGDGKHMGERQRRRRLPAYPDPDQALWPVGKRAWHRDVIIIAFALGGLFTEIVFLGARPSVLTALTAVLLSPLLLRVDQHRKDNPPCEDPDEQADRVDG
jgi:hypothetical protein